MLSIRFHPFTVVAVSLSSWSLLLGTACGFAQIQSADRSAASAYLRHRQFRIEQLGELIDPDVPHLGFSAYKARDGSVVTVIHNNFPSPTMAQQYLEKKISKAAEVVKQDVTRDRGDTTISIRVQVEFASEPPSKRMHAVLWTKGSEFYQVQSYSSLKDVLEFEKVFR